MFFLICLQGKCQLTFVTGGCLEPTCGHNTIHRNACGLQRGYCGQVKVRVICIQDDIPVTVIDTVVIAVDTRNVDGACCLYSAICMGIEHIFLFQGVAAQHHTGRKDYLVVSLVRCQGERQRAGTRLEPASCGCAVNGRTGCGQGCRRTQGETGIVGTQNDIPVVATEVVGIDTGDRKFVCCSRCSKNRYHREN